MTERNRPRHTERHRFRQSESGNVFFTLFGAVAIVGVLGAGIMATMRGPLTTMVNVQKKATAEAQMGIAAKLAILEAASQANSGDCDADQFVEPMQYDTAIVALGGGTLPAAVGSNRQDPWGSDYGYCAWDAGTVVSPDIGN
ncbi:MAG TPA: hypothetical protein DEA55_06610, partial [Rhodospirillaceae bacterium]|nr:hypothetical protein [Rhodospirillaceae bacterium]